MLSKFQISLIVSSLSLCRSQIAETRDHHCSGVLHQESLQVAHSSHNQMSLSKCKSQPAHLVMALKEINLHVLSVSNMSDRFHFV